MFWNKLTLTKAARELASASRGELRATNAGRELAPASRGKLIFALDATNSRQATWEQACSIQSTMFDVAAGHGGLDLKLVFYQGIETCKASAWTNNTAELRKWMRAVTCEGGQTQIERVLNHALSMAATGRVDALVFVGDAVEESSERLYQLSRALGERGVPIFIFQEGKDPAASIVFSRMASLSGGAHLSFDLASLNRLRDLLGAVAVYASGGHLALEQHAQRSRNSEVLKLTSQIAKK